MDERFAPCPFCGQALHVVDRKSNPYACCKTEGCKGKQLPLLNIDQPDDVAAWNRRAAQAEPSAQPVWRCFHCDEVFADAESAALHFGRSEMQSPACSIDIAEYRAMEQRMRSYSEEDTALHREIHGLLAKHQTELMRAEEKGYARGLADGMKEANQQQAEPAIIAQGGVSPAFKLANRIVKAVVEDMKPESGGCDISAGLFGPHFSALIREIAK